MWAEVIHGISSLSQKTFQVTFHALFFPPGHWLDMKDSEILRYEGTTKWKDLGSLNHCVEGSPLDTWMKFTCVRNKFLLYYTTEILEFVCYSSWHFPEQCKMPF